jgi:hypothetical protein
MGLWINGSCADRALSTQARSASADSFEGFVPLHLSLRLKKTSCVGHTLENVVVHQHGTVSIHRYTCQHHQEESRALAR